MVMNGNGGEDEEKIETVTETVRIFVGGLGAKVTAEDLRSTFGCLGRINSVDLIRTKGRSFAYFDFIPSSHKSLSKLFSMYNGCMWKGGRLKLEKAKEHYLLRLKQERSEDAELANSTVYAAVDATKSKNSLENLNKAMNLKTSEIRLFFPKLRKLRPLPFNGTGKHKYSFQRIEVPALPIHFCDCDEHSKPLYPAWENKLSVHEAKNGGIDEKEFNIMESVMNKLLERGDKSKAEISRYGMINEKENAPEPVDDLAVDDGEKDDNVDEDDDNLVMNTVAMGSIRNSLLKSGRQETKVDNERVLVNRLQISKAKALYNEPMSQRIKTLPSGRKRKSPNAEPIDGKVACIDIEGKTISKKIGPHDSARDIEKASATRKANINASLLRMKENNLKPGGLLVDEGEAATDVAFDENEADEMTEEDDNLVLNMVGGGNIKRQQVEGWREETISDNKGALMAGVKLSDIMVKNPRNKFFASEKKRNSPHTEATDRKVDPIHIEGKRSLRKVPSHDLTQATEIISSMQKSNFEDSSWKHINTTDEKQVIKCSNTRREELDSNSIQNQNQNLLPDLKNLKSQSNSSKERREAATPPKKPNAVLDKQPKKGAFWAQKSSWTNLVGERDASFSISQLLPDIKFEKQEQLDRSKECFAAKPIIDEPSDTTVKSSGGASFSNGGCDRSSKVVNEKAIIAPVRYSIGETCSFKRSDSSMQEWESTKAALSRSLKKKTNEK